MEHLFLLRSQAHELKMRQMVEEINLSRHAIESAMTKYQVLTRKTVTQWLERVRQEEQTPTQGLKQAATKPVPTLVERVTHTERLNGILKQEYLSHQAVRSLDEAQQHLGRAVFLYAYKRPHLSGNRPGPNEARSSWGALKRRWKN